MGDGDGGGFDHAPPPVGGLGNFKGVMLCNRPSDDSNTQNAGGDGAGPFKSMVASTHGDQLGLGSCRNFEPTVKKRGPSAALRRHVKWLKELQDQMKDERCQVEEEEADVIRREEKLKETFHGHRDGVREMIRERNDREDAEEKAATLKKRAEKEAAKAKKNGTAAKPMWAMTEKEKDDFEEGEADDLINFAENLDYDKFIADTEFRQGLDSLKDRAGRLKKEQDAFKDALISDFNTRADGEEDEDRSTCAGESHFEDGLDGRSLGGDQRSEYSVGSRRSAGAQRYNDDGRPEWDASTNQGDENDRGSVRSAKEAAEAILEMNPKMKQVHSKESAARLIEKARERQQVEYPKDLISMMREEGQPPIPVITTSSDTLNRLHKPTEPSMLPYLYRSPAI